jgi:carboxymethylenebutenolidase
MNTETYKYQAPLTRRGIGPLLILVVDAEYDLSGHGKTLDPPPLKKWAEEGFSAAQLTWSHTNDDASRLQATLDGLRGWQARDQSCGAGLIS